MKTTISRISSELHEEIKRIAKLNNEQFTKASDQVAYFLKDNRRKKIKREINF